MRLLMAGRRAQGEIAVTFLKRRSLFCYLGMKRKCMCLQTINLRNIDENFKIEECNNCSNCIKGVAPFEFK